jgi:hypothetical protein
MMDEEMSTKEAREGILGAIRATKTGEFTLPDPGMDVSECFLASMESVSWAMVKNELSGDGEHKDLADWRLVDMVSMLDNRTVVPLKLRGQVLKTLRSAHQGCLAMACV